MVKKEYFCADCHTAFLPERHVHLVNTGEVGLCYECGSDAVDSFPTSYRGQSTPLPGRNKDCKDYVY